MQRILDQLPDDLRHQALTHPAFAPSRGESYERLEFLGDSVLDLVVSDAIYRRHPELPEGELSRVRAGAVSREACAEVAREHDLGGAMVQHAAAHGPAARASAELLAGQRNTLAALTESLVGAGFLALGWPAVAPLVLAVFEDRIEHALANRIDAKSRLQELASRQGAVVAYEELRAEGPAHQREFTVAARIDDKHSAEGSGRSKQEAQQRAAASLLAMLERE